MSIKARIFLILFIFIVVVVGLGVSSIYLSRLQADYFTTSSSYINLRENMSEAKRIFLDQAQSFDYYIFLSQETEKHNFREKKGELIKKINEIKDTGFLPGYIEDLRDKIWQLNLRFEEAVELAEKNRIRDAVSLSKNQILNSVRQIKDIFENRINELNKRVEESRSTALSFKQKMTTYFFSSFSVIIGIMLLMSYGLYRSIASPLKKFEHATAEISEGNIDYRLDLKARNEFRKIASSFNKMLEDLQKYQDKITQMGKMAAVGELSGGVAHEINNPLTGILGHTQRLLLKVPKEDDLYPVIKKMERAALRCRTIVSGLLDFSRSKAYNFQMYDIHDIIEDTFTLCETGILLGMSKNFTLNKYYGSGIPEVKVSKKNIQQVFLNIIFNSVQAMPEGGTLEVVTKKVKKGGKKYVLIKFTDSGIGFTEQVSSRAFEPFYTTKEVGEGTGLGLSISYRIIKNHDGIIELSSPGPGKGAVVSVFLPI